MALQPEAPQGPFSRPYAPQRRQAWRLLASALALGGLAGLGWWWLSAPAAAPAPATLPDRSGSPAAFVPSQQGTTPDGDVRALKALAQGGEAGALAYGELRRLFDYYLSALGERDLPAITQQIQSQLDQRLSPAQAAQAKRLLGLYIAFKRRLVDLEARPGLAGDAVAAIRRRMLAQQDLRTQYFTAAEMEGMFGFEDAYDADAIARLEISQNADLKPGEKAQKLAALDAAMGPALRAERDASVVVTRVEQRAADMRAQGASDDEVYRMRAQEFDASAAARLAELDREEADWKRRIAQYLEARTQILKAQANASVSERLQALTELQQRLFTEDERRRLVAYEPAG
ncbi:MAG: lipase chaperone [Burkholderiales bacterium PBB4]|nr:MAG: lipase chaperone [Burkholderiales bacterium PBB4]